MINNYLTILFYGIFVYHLLVIDARESVFYILVGSQLLPIFFAIF